MTHIEQIGQRSVRVADSHFIETELSEWRKNAGHQNLAKMLPMSHVTTSGVIRGAHGNLSWLLQLHLDRSFVVNHRPIATSAVCSCPTGWWASHHVTMLDQLFTSYIGCQFHCASSSRSHCWCFWRTRINVRNISVKLWHQSAACPSQRRLRSSNYTNYTTPRTRTKFGERAFSVAGPSIWNSLPEHILSATIKHCLNIASKLIILTFILMCLSLFSDFVMPGRSGCCCRLGNKYF